MLHELKIHPNFLEDIRSGRKTFEVRQNDRNYGVGDFLYLRGYNPLLEDDGYCYGSEICRVTYLMNDPHYVKKGFVILGIKLLQ